MVDTLTLCDPGYFRQLTIQGAFKAPPPTISKTITSITDFGISFDLSSSRLSSFIPTTVSEVQELLTIMNQTMCSLQPELL